MEEPDEEILEEFDWELKISYQYAHLIIQDGAIMANDIMELAETIMKKYSLDELEIFHGESKLYNCVFINGEVDIVRKL